MSGASEESCWYQSEFARQLAREEQQQQAREEQQQQVREKQREKSWEQLEMRRKQQETPLEREQQKPGWRPRLLEEARLSGSVDSLPSLTRRSQETWLSSKEFRELLDRNEKVEREDQSNLIEPGLVELQQENQQLRRRLCLAGGVERVGGPELGRGGHNTVGLDMGGGRTSSATWAVLDGSDELQRDVSRLQAKICKMEQFSSNPSSTRRLLTFLESFKSQLPLLEEGGPVDAGRERAEGRLSVGSYRRATARDSLGGYQTTMPSRACPTRSRVMGARRLRELSLANRSASSTSLLWEGAGEEESGQHDTHHPPNTAHRSRVNRSKSFTSRSGFLRKARFDDEECDEDSGRGTIIETSTTLDSCRESVQQAEAVPSKNLKTAGRVKKFFKRLKRVVVKEKKNQGSGFSGVRDHSRRKISRSLSHRISKPRHFPKRLKSFHCSSPRLTDY